MKLSEFKFVKNEWNINCEKEKERKKIVYKTEDKPYQTILIDNKESDYFAKTLFF